MKQASLSKIIGNQGIFVDGDWVESKDQDPNGDVRLIQLADIGDGIFINKSKRYLTSEKAKELKCTFLKPGDLLIARMPDPIGRACIFPQIEMPCVTVVDVCIVRPDKNIVSSEWLKLLINSHGFRKAINKYITGTTRQRISRGNLEKLKFDIPSIEDQKRIVKIFDKADILRQKRKQAIELLDGYLKSVFLEMFGDPVKNPNGWKVRKLGKLSRVITKGESPKWQGFEYIKEGVRFITSENVLLGQLNLSKNKYVAETFHNKLRRSKLKLNDLLVNLVGASIGRGAIVIEEALPANINQAVAKIELLENVADPVFMLFQLISKQIQNKLTGCKVEGARANISLTNVRDLEFLVPPIELQNKFAEIVKKVELLKQKMLTQSEELENQFQALMQKAFKGAL